MPDFINSSYHNFLFCERLSIYIMHNSKAQ